MSQNNLVLPPTKKPILLIGISLSLLFLIIAAYYYPGGSQHDPNSIGYDWQHNYLSNLFSAKAENGQDNLSRPWAIGGMFFLCVSFAWFFISFSKKIPSKSGAGVIKYCGVASMLFAFLAVTPYHDLMITIGGTAALITMFYITVFLFKSSLHLLKLLSILCLLLAYACNYVYYSQNHLELLPIMQKIEHLLLIVLVLSLEYFTKKEDF